MAVPQLSPSDLRPHPRWRIVRDVAALQLKLMLGNLQNFALMPICLFAGAIDILFKNRRHEALLYKALAWGRHVEDMIGVYGALETDDGRRHNPRPRYNVDALLERVETTIKAEYARGGTTATVKAAVDKVLDQAAAKVEPHKARAKEAVARTAEKLRTRTEKRERT